MSHEICLFTCPTIMHAIKTPYRAHSMKNLKCPHCAKSMIFQKFLFISPEMNFNCTQCKAALELVNRVSPRLLIYSGLILVIPCFFWAILGKSTLSFSLFGIVMIIFSIACLSCQKVISVDKKQE